MLILSDLHLGKSGHFRKEGIPIPQKVYEQDLIRLFDTIRYFGPDEVMIVGDLFHSRVNREWDLFARWRADHAKVHITLVLGNHDRLPEGLPGKLSMDVFPFLQRGPFAFQHNAEDANGPSGNGHGVISGHVHPAIRVSAGARQSLRLPCFHFSPTTCTLPAFSIFSGHHTIKPKAGDSVFAITGEDIIKVQGRP